MGKTRTFLGIDIGPAIRQSVSDLQRQLHRTGADVNWTSPDLMHVTVLFLGDLNDRELVTVCRIAAEIAAREPRFTMRVRGTGAFPTPRRPKTLWAGIADESGTLQSLHRQLEARLIDAIGYRPEERGYTPHLTLGRVKPQSDTTVLAAELGRLSEWDGGEVLVQELRIYRSELRREGPEYTVIGRGAFGE
jgi:2'-5' RNA ligase